MKFSDRLKTLRQERKVSQKDLSDLIGVTPRAWRFYESGDREPNITSLIALADFFDVSIDYLVGRSDTPNRK